MRVIVNDVEYISESYDEDNLLLKHFRVLINNDWYYLSLCRNENGKLTVYEIYYEGSNTWGIYDPDIFDEIIKQLMKFNKVRLYLVT